MYLIAKFYTTDLFWMGGEGGGGNFGTRKPFPPLVAEQLW